MARHTRRVWLKERKNPKRQNDATRTVSYTLQWKDEKTGKDRFQSLGPLVTKEDAEKKRAEKEIQLNLRKTEVLGEVATPIRLHVLETDICGFLGQER